MPINQPGRGDAHIDAPLTNVAVAFTQTPDAFVADRAFPILPVAKQTNKYFVVPKGEWFRDQMKKRAPGTESAERTHTLSTDSYECDVWALHEMLADQVLANYDSPLKAEFEMTEGLAQAGMIRKELAWVTAFFAASIWTGEPAWRTWLRFAPKSRPRT